MSETGSARGKPPSKSPSLRSQGVRLHKQLTSLELENEKVVNFAYEKWQGISQTRITGETSTRTKHA